MPHPVKIAAGKVEQARLEITSHRYDGKNATDLGERATALPIQLRSKARDIIMSAFQPIASDQLKVLLSWVKHKDKP